MMHKWEMYDRYCSGCRYQQSNAREILSISIGHLDSLLADEDGNVALNDFAEAMCIACQRLNEEVAL